MKTICPHCDVTLRIPEGVFRNADAQVTLQCPSCSGRIVLPTNTVSYRYYYLRHLIRNGWEQGQARVDTNSLYALPLTLWIFSIFVRLMFYEPVRMVIVTTTRLVRYSGLGLAQGLMQSLRGMNTYLESKPRPALSFFKNFLALVIIFGSLAYIRPLLIFSKEQPEPIWLAVLGGIVVLFLLSRLILARQVRFDQHGMGINISEDRLINRLLDKSYSIILFLYCYAWSVWLSDQNDYALIQNGEFNSQLYFWLSIFVWMGVEILSSIPLAAIRRGDRRDRPKNPPSAPPMPQARTASNQSDNPAAVASQDSAQTQPIADKQSTPKNGPSGGGLNSGPGHKSEPVQGGLARAMGPPK